MMPGRQFLVDNGWRRLITFRLLKIYESRDERE